MYTKRYRINYNISQARDRALMSNTAHTRLILEYSCNKCCNLIGHSEVSISHRDLQVFHRDLQLSSWGQKSKVSVSLQ